MSPRLEDVVERLQLRWVATRCVSQSLRQEPVGQPRVPGQEWAVEVRPDGPPDAAALGARLAVVAESRDNPAERLRARVEPRPADVVLEPRKRPLAPRL